MRKILLVLLLGVTTIAVAQTQKELRDSLKIITQQSSFAPDSIDLRLKKASYNVLLEQWEYAKNEYDYVLNRDPFNIAALYYRAYVNEKMGRYNFARLDYNNLLTVVPGNFEAQLGLALLNQKDRHFTEAMDGINILVETYPDSAVAYAARAGIERERQMYELAVYDFDKAHAIDPDNRDYMIGKIDALILAGRKEEAERGLNELVKTGTPRASLADLYKRCKK